MRGFVFSGLAAGDFGFERHGIARIVIRRKNYILMQPEGLGESLGNLPYIDQALVQNRMDRSGVALKNDSLCPHIGGIEKPDLRMPGLGGVEGRIDARKGEGTV